ncbi:helix-turn-helix transcriptional regulator [Halobacterium yunchengense]|uniref:helix-turn-helix transcriptional regulator n=1 Tax=Halobacterium yunchengense TaxID=3108497 RepID=UPI00300AC5C8
MARGSESSFREGVSKRYPVLEALLGEPKSKRALTEELPHSRSTVDRAIRELQSLGCVDTVDSAGRYRVTHVGRLGFEYERTYRERMATVADSAALLEGVPADAPLATEFVAGMQAHVSRRAPDVAFQPGRELVERADRLRGTATVVRRQYFDVLGEQVHSDGFELELVLDGGLVEVINRNYAAEFASLTEAAGVTILESEDPIPYALWLTDDDGGTTAGITLHADGGVKGSMTNAAPAAVEWAESQYEQYRANAVRVV